jgi:hypothetical protein
VIEKNAGNIKVLDQERISLILLIVLIDSLVYFSYKLKARTLWITVPPARRADATHFISLFTKLLFL